MEELNIGNNFDDLFDLDNATSVENSESIESESVELPDSTDLDEKPAEYGVDEKPEDNNSEHEELELDV